MSSSDNMGAAPSSIEQRVHALEQENALLKKALKEAALGVWSWDLEDTVTCDAGMCRLLDLPESEAVSVADLLMAFREGDHVRLLDAFDAARLSDDALDETFELQHDTWSSEGQLRILGQMSADGRSLSGICSFVASGAAAGIARGSQRNALPEYRIDRFFNLSAGLYLELDFDGYVKWVNPRCESVLGFTLQEFAERLYLDFIHPEDLAPTRQLVERVVSGQEDDSAEQSFENRCRCKDGSFRWLSWRWDVDVERRLIYAIARDVTEAKTQQERLASTLAQVQDSNAELQSFASVASHDLREPLRMISSYLRLLQERAPDALDTRAQRYINYACEGADRMRGLIEDLLSYSRLGTPGQRFEPVALDEVLADAIRNLSMAIQNAGAEVTVDINNSPVVFGDRSRLVRLFQNLLANSIKFHAEGSLPRVSVGFVDGHIAGEPDRWVVTIRDNGIGIDPDHQGLLFNVFRRLNTRDEFEGSGIGLAVCKKIAEQHEGRIWVASELGKGSTFYVTLAKLQEASIRD